MKQIKHFIVPMLLLLSILSTNTIQCMYQKFPLLGKRLFCGILKKRNTTITISPNQKYIVTRENYSGIEEDKNGHLIDIKRKEEITTFPNLCSAIFSPDSKIVVAIQENRGTVSRGTIYDLEQRRELFRGQYTNASFTKDSQYLFLTKAFQSEDEVYKIHRYNDENWGPQTRFLRVKAYKKILHKETNANLHYLLVMYKKDGITRIDIIDSGKLNVIRTFNSVKAGHFNPENSQELIIQYTNDTAKIFEIIKDEDLDENNTFIKKEEILNKFISSYNIDNTNFLVIKNWNKLIKTFKLEDKAYANLNRITLEFSQDLTYMLEKETKPYSEVIRGIDTNEPVIVRVELFGNNRNKEFLPQGFGGGEIWHTKFTQDSKNNNFVVVERAEEATSEIFDCANNKTVTISKRNKKRKMRYKLKFVDTPDNKTHIHISNYYCGSTPRAKKGNSGIKVFNLDAIAKISEEQNKLFKQIDEKNYIDLIIRFKSFCN